MSLYEAVIRTPVVDAYGKHKFLERQFKERDDHIRKYTWTSGEGRMAIVRYFEPLGNGFTWTTLESPPKDTKIRFNLCAHVRQGTHVPGSSNECNRELDYADCIRWIEGKSPEIGWRLLAESVDVNPVTIPISGKVPTGEQGIRPFRLFASQFDGIATIEDPVLFMQALTKGVGNAKAFGLGFIMFTIFGRKSI